MIGKSAAFSLLTHASIVIIYLDMAFYRLNH
jgi:hypothetical protein